MNASQTLAARRHLLVACSTLQRVRLAHEWQLVRTAAQPARWAAAGLGSAGAFVARSLLAHRSPGIARPRAGVWAARAFALWRLVRALRRLMAGTETGELT